MLQTGSDSSGPWLSTRPTLPPSDLIRSVRRGRLPAPLDAGGVTLHVKARNGIWQLLRALGLGASDIVLVPSYNCGAELDAVVRAHASVRFYRVDRLARIDLDDLRQAIDPRTRAVVVTHYFGFAQPDLPEIVELCRDHGLVLIEDCAHALYSTYLGRSLGTFGDAGIFSLWKTLPIADGGAVLANRPLPLDDGSATPPLAASVNHLRLSLEAHVLFRYGNAGRVVSWLNRLAELGARAWRDIARHNAASPATLEPSLNPHVTFDRSTAHLSMSPASRRIASRSPHAEIAQRRRRNYAFLAAELAGLSGARPLHPTVPTGACPLAFPLVVDEPASLLRQLERNRIGAEPFWSEFHSAFPAHEFPDSTYLKTHVVTVPVHQDLDDQLLARVVEVVRRWSRDR